MIRWHNFHFHVSRFFKAEKIDFVFAKEYTEQTRCFHTVIQTCPKFSQGADHRTRSDFIRPSVLKFIIYGQPALSDQIKKKSCKFIMQLLLSPHGGSTMLCNIIWLCDPCCDPNQLISATVTVDKKRKVDVEGLCLEIMFFH